MENFPLMTLLDEKGKIMKVKYFKPWILFFIVGSVGGGIAGFIVGLFSGIIMTIAGVESQPMHALVGGVAGYIISIPISFLVYKWSVKKFVLSQLEPVPGEEKENIQPPLSP